MGQRIIAENAHITSVTYKLPNKHYDTVDLKYIGIDNTSPSVLCYSRCPDGLRSYSPVLMRSYL